MFLWKNTYIFPVCKHLVGVHRCAFCFQSNHGMMCAVEEGIFPDLGVKMSNKKTLIQIGDDKYTGFEKSISKFSLSNKKPLSQLHFKTKLLKSCKKHL